MKERESNTWGQKKDYLKVGRKRKRRSGAKGRTHMGKKIMGTRKEGRQGRHIKVHLHLISQKNGRHLEALQRDELHYGEQGKKKRWE